MDVYKLYAFYSPNGICTDVYVRAKPMPHFKRTFTIYLYEYEKYMCKYKKFILFPSVYIRHRLKVCLYIDAINSNKMICTVGLIGIGLQTISTMKLTRLYDRMYFQRSAFCCSYLLNTISSITLILKNCDHFLLIRYSVTVEEFYNQR